MCFITSLLLYHVNFFFKNMTTYAKAKLQYVLIYSWPFNRGLKKNLIFIFCRKILKRVDFTENINYIPAYYQSQYESTMPVHNLNEKENIIRILNREKEIDYRREDIQFEFLEENSYGMHKFENFENLKKILVKSKFNHIEISEENQNNNFISNSSSMVNKVVTNKDENGIDFFDGDQEIENEKINWNSNRLQLKNE